MIPLWNKLAAAAGLTLTQPQHALLHRYLDLLLHANQAMNLTRITDRSSAEVLHIADALTLLPFLPREVHRLADIGSGGGVPGIPIAIARPDIEVTLIESTAKKAKFLSQTAAALDLPQVRVAAQRAETLARGPQRESFDVAAARALAPMSLLVEWCLPLVKRGGRLLAMKGAKVSEELPAAEKAIRMLSGGRTIIHPVALPGAQSHVIVEIPKTGRTDPRYPRPAGQAKNNPLGHRTR